MKRLLDFALGYAYSAPLKPEMKIQGLFRYTPRNENFVLVLEGISRARPLAR